MPNRANLGEVTTSVAVIAHSTKCRNITGDDRRTGSHRFDEDDSKALPAEMRCHIDVRCVKGTSLVSIRQPAKDRDRVSDMGYAPRQSLGITSPHDNDFDTWNCS